MRPFRFLPLLSGFALLLADLVVDAQIAPALAGRWEGTLILQSQEATQRGRLSGGRDISAPTQRLRLPTVVVITTAGDGTYGGTWTSTRQDLTANLNITEKIGAITIDGANVHIGLTVGGSWTGKLSADGSKLDGKWTQAALGQTSPLVLKRVAVPPERPLRQ